MTALTTTITAKVPMRLRDEAETVASQRRITVSVLVRNLLEREVAETVGRRVGPVEQATLSELAEMQGPWSETRVAVALDLARRMDSDTTNGAAHARELRATLDELGGRRIDDFTPLDELQARRILRLAGYTVTDPAGRLLGQPRPAPETREWSENDE